MLVCVLFWGWGYSFRYNNCLDIPCPQPHLLFPDTSVRAFAATIRILSASPFNARNNCWGGWRQRSAHVPWTPLKSFFSSLGQLAERVCRFPQVELITIANWDLSGSRGRNELMEVGSAFLTLWAWLETSVQETCGHYLITKCFFDLRLPWAHWKTPDWWNGMIIWVMQAHVTCRHRRNPNICTNAWCGLLLTIRAAEDSSIHRGGADLGTIARSGWVMGTEEISLTHFTDGEIKPWSSWLLCLGFVPRVIPTSKAMLFAFDHRFTEWEPRSFTPIEDFLSAPFYQYTHHLENQSCVASVFPWKMILHLRSQNAQSSRDQILV